jgi:hypothetical protein
MERWSTREGYDERTAPPAAARPPCLEKEKKRKEKKRKRKRKEKKRKEKEKDPTGMHIK